MGIIVWWGLAAVASLLAGAAVLVTAAGVVLGVDGGHIGANLLMAAMIGATAPGACAVVAGLLAPSQAKRAALVAAIGSGALIIIGGEITTTIAWEMDASPAAVAWRLLNGAIAFVPFLFGGGLSGVLIISDREKRRLGRWDPAPIT